MNYPNQSHLIFSLQGGCTCKVHTVVHLQHSSDDQPQQFFNPLSHQQLYQTAYEQKHNTCSIFSFIDADG